MIRNASRKDARWSVRRAGSGDEPVIRALRLEAMTESPYAFGSTLERELARTDADWQRWLSPGVTFLVEDAQRARGLVAAAHDADDRSVVDLMAMWVHPQLRGSGAADALVAAVVEWATAEGARVVRLRVVAGNPAARHRYMRNGFEETGRQVTRERDGAVEIEMDRRIHTDRRG